MAVVAKYNVRGPDVSLELYPHQSDTQVANEPILTAKASIVFAFYAEGFKDFPRHDRVQLSRIHYTSEEPRVRAVGTAKCEVNAECASTIIASDGMACVHSGLIVHAAAYTNAGCSKLPPTTGCASRPSHCSTSVP